jgi:hypothetical protein
MFVVTDEYMDLSSSTSPTNVLADRLKFNNVTNKRIGRPTWQPLIISCKNRYAYLTKVNALTINNNEK